MKINQSLNAKALRGFKWTSLSTFFQTSIQFLNLWVMTNFLSPSDFGLMGMIMVVVGFANQFADMGVSNAIIHRQEITNNQLSSLYWLNIFAGIVVFLLINISIFAIVEFYNEPRLTNLLFITSFIFLIAPIAQQYQILLQKNLSFNILSIIDIIGVVVNSGTTIWMAVNGFGVYSFVYGQLANTTIKVFILCNFCWRQWRPCFHFSKKDLAGFLKFGLFQMGERSVNYLSANLDYILIGRYLGSTELGYYTLAYQIIIFPLTKLNPIFTKVMFPVFSIVQNNNHSIRSGYCKIIKYVSLVTFLLMAGILMLAHEFVNLFLGEKWHPSILLIQILCGVGILKSLGNPSGSVLLAKGRADIGFYINIFVLILVYWAVIIGLNWGIVGVTLSLLFFSLLIYVPCQMIVNNLIELSIKQFVKTLYISIQCFIMVILFILCLKWIFGPVVSIVPFLGIVISSAISYILTVYWIDREIFMELLSLFGRNQQCQD